MDVTHRYFKIAFLNFAKFLLDLLTDLKIVSNGHENYDPISSFLMMKLISTP